MAEPGAPAHLRRENWEQLLRFCVVGGSGVLVNLLTLVAVSAVAPDAHSVFLDLPGTDFNVRWYHVLSTVAFLVANVSNFQLNRAWTFRSAGSARWRAEYLPFLAVGLAAQAVGLLLLTALLHPDSPVGLPRDLLDDSSLLRTRLYWGQLLVIGFVTPLSYVLNKVWTFRAVRRPAP